jgi:hypothetical protein
MKLRSILVGLVVGVLTGKKEELNPEIRSILSRAQFVVTRYQSSLFSV